jgi:AraC-like DNA-binding protein
MDLRSYLKNTPASSAINLTLLAMGFCVGPEPRNLGLPGPALQRKLKDNCQEMERGNPPKDLPNPISFWAIYPPRGCFGILILKLLVAISVESTMLGEVLLEMDEPLPPVSPMPRGISTTPMSEELSGAVIRLLECLKCPLDSRMLGRPTAREIVYRVLRGEQGGSLRALANRDGRFIRIARVLKHIHTEHAKPLSVESMAKRAGMGIAAFHHNFKLATASSPLQYLKRIRLDRARRLMAHDGYNASTAARARRLAARETLPVGAFNVSSDVHATAHRNDFDVPDFSKDLESCRHRYVPIQFSICSVSPSLKNRIGGVRPPCAVELHAPADQGDVLAAEAKTVG